MLRVVLCSVAAGVAGTLTGGVISLAIKGKGERRGALFFVSAVIMLYVVFFDLLPQAAKLSDGITLICGIAAGVIAVVILNLFAEPTAAVLLKAENGDASTLKTAAVMLLVIAAHNFPEGLAIGAGYSVNAGLKTAVAIGLHNIPEGIAVAVPMLVGGVNKRKAVLLTGLTGAPTLFGAVIGYLSGMRSAVYAAVSLGAASGAMLGVTAFDMAPEIIKSAKSKLRAKRQ